MNKRIITLAKYSILINSLVLFHSCESSDSVQSLVCDSNRLQAEYSEKTDDPNFISSLTMSDYEKFMKKMDRDMKKIEKRTEKLMREIPMGDYYDSIDEAGKYCKKNHNSHKR